MIQITKGLKSEIIKNDKERKSNLKCFNVFISLEFTMWIMIVKLTKLPKFLVNRVYKFRSGPQVETTTWIKYHVEGPFRESNLQLNMTFTQNGKKSTQHNDKLSIACYRPFILVLSFTFRNEGQLPTFYVNGHWIFLKQLKIIHQNFTLWLDVS